MALSPLVIMPSSQKHSRILVQPMQSLAETRYADDDWTGLTDAAARRKRQNRLNIRAHRRRKAQATLIAQVSTGNVSKTESVPCWVESQQRIVFLPVEAQRNQRLPLLSMTGDTSAELQKIILPLSSDHLITLLQYRVLRGCLEIRHILSCTFAEDDGGDPEELHVCSYSSKLSTNTLPVSLVPTSLQCSTAHPYWIDLIPQPRFRDNLIRALGTFDADEMWSDAFGGLFEGFPDSRAEEQGIILWDKPWDPYGWELSAGFVDKWRWALRGCEDLFEAIDIWRLKRGDDKLNIRTQPESTI